MSKNVDIHKVLQASESGISTRLRIFEGVPLYCKVDIKGKLETLNAAFVYNYAGDLKVFTSTLTKERLPSEKNHQQKKYKPQLMSFEPK